MTLQDVDVLELQALRARFHGVEDMLAVQPFLVDDARLRGVEYRVRAIVGPYRAVDLSSRTLSGR